MHFVHFLSDNLYLSTVASIKTILIYAEETKKEASQYLLLFQRGNDNIPRSLLLLSLIVSKGKGVDEACPFFK